MSKIILTQVGVIQKSLKYHCSDVMHFACVSKNGQKRCAP